MALLLIMKGLYFWSLLTYSLFHQGRISEVLLAFFFSLDPGVLNATDLFTVENCPLLLVESLVEGSDMFKLLEVDERVTHVAVVLEVDGQVEEVVGVVEVCVDGLQHELLSVLVGYVADHQGSFPFVVDIVDANLELARVFHLPKVPLALLLLIVLARLVCAVFRIVPLAVAGVSYSLYE